jgi:prevent-host-death family protein
MDKIVSAADANRRFSELLRGVRKGLRYVVTSHGRPVAQISPVEADDGSGAAARAALMARLKSQPVGKDQKGRKRWTRNELYEDK